MLGFNDGSPVDDPTLVGRTCLEQRQRLPELLVVPMDRITMWLRADFGHDAQVAGRRSAPDQRGLIDHRWIPSTHAHAGGQ